MTEHDPVFVVKIDVWFRGPKKNSSLTTHWRRISLTDTSDRAHKVSRWITATIAALDLCRKPGRPKGKTVQPWAQQAVSPWGELVEVVRENYTYYHYHIASYGHHDWFILWYVLLQCVTIICSTTRSFVVDCFGHFTSASQRFAVDQWTIFCCLCFCFTFQNFTSTMAIFGVL